ncbi:MAG TPA: DUF2066 domain-containing protein [Steroidobacteraceae bacterium]|jgi:hypothetical protein|nr:DUF2066 domain-containing protein [Steroidobacteraceae bacterium]
MPRRHTTAKILGREALLLAACAVLPAAAWAARPVAVFQVDVAGETVPALQQAMRAALVRATGRRESASDPVFAALITDAPKYVQSYDRGPRGEPQVLFNGAAVDKAIAAVDRSVWDPNRPFTLVVLYPAPGQGDQPADEAALEQAAEERGLPISIVPLPVADDSGALLSREALLEMAHRYGAEQLLVGTPPAPTPAPPAAVPPGNGAPASSSAPAAGAPPAAAQPGTAQAAASAPAAFAPSGLPPAWQWRLYTDFTTQSWTGPLTAGIDDTVDALAPPLGAAAANAPGQTEVEIEGVSSLADYANIELMLGAVPGVSAANIRQVSGDSVLFDLTVRGGGATVDRALSGSPSFTRVTPGAPGGGALVYRYRPG